MRRRIDIAIATAALVLGAAVPYGAARHAEERLQHGLVDRLASALGEPVHIDGVHAGLTGELVIRGLRIGDLVALDTLDVRLDVEAALSGRTEVREIHANGAHLNARVAADGSSDLARLLDRVRELARDLRTRGRAADIDAGARAPIALSLTGGSLAAELERHGRIQISDIAARAWLGQPSVRVSAGRVRFDGAAGALAVRGELERMAADIDMRERRLQRLVSVTGNLSLVSPTGQTTELSQVSITRGLAAADVEADEPDDKPDNEPDEPDNELVRLDAQVQGPAAGQPAHMTLVLLGSSGRVERLELRGQALPLAVLEPWSPRSLDVTHTRFSGRALVELAPATARLEADGAVHELTIDDTRVAREPVTLTGDLRARVTASLAGQDTGAEAGHRIALEELVWDTPGLRVQLSGELGYQARAPRKGPRSDTGRVAARDTWLPDTASLSLVVPTTRCASALGAMPEVFRRRLVGLDLGGSLSARVAIEFRRATVKDTRLDVDVDADGCRVLRDALAADPRTIAQPLERAYATLDQLPEYTQRAFVTMEDARFFRHHGFDRAQIERSLAVDLNAAAFVRGGSTITQQLVKNAFLSHERTLARKFQEAVLTWRVEAVAEKSQILERYLNIIELGPDTHGIEAAARFWFGKSADRLGVRESAFLAALTPAPRTISRRILEHGGIDPATDERIDQVLAVMRRHDVISERIYQKALRFPLELVAVRSPATSSSTSASTSASASAASASDAQEQAVAEVALQL